MNVVLIRIIIVTVVSIFSATSVYTAFDFSKFEKSNGEALPMQLSADDLQMLEQIDQEVNQYVNNLSEEDQKKFWNEVETLSNEMSNMSPEELETFMGQVFAGEDPSLVKEDVAKIPEPTVELPTTKKPDETPGKATPIIIDQHKQEAALRIIDTILSRIENFNTKITPIVDIDEKVERWGHERIIQNWPAGTTWNSFNQETSFLISDLKKLKSRDTRTNAYKYLDAFIQNESLYTQLAKLSTDLTIHTQNIQRVPLGATQMVDISKNALQMSIGSLAEAIYIHQIHNQLTQIFAGYDSIAQTIKKQEEELRKRAEQQAAQKPTRSQTHVAGKPEGRMADRSPGSYKFGDDFDQFTSPMAQPSSFARSTTKPGTTSKPSSPTPTTAGAPKASTDVRKPEETKAPSDKRAKQYVSNFDTAFDTAIGALQSIPWVGNIESHITSPVPQFSRNDVDSIVTATRSLRKSVDIVRSINIRLKKLTSAQNKLYIEQIRESFDIQAPYLSKISSEIARIDNRWNSIKGSVSIAKRYAYCGARDVPFELVQRGGALQRDPQVEEVMRILPEIPISLFDLRQTIDELKRLVANIGHTK